MTTLRTALLWVAIAWMTLTVLVFVKVLVAPELVIATPLSNPAIGNVTLVLLFGSLVALFFMLPPIEPLVVLLIALLAALRSLWRRP